MTGAHRTPFRSLTVLDTLILEMRAVVCGEERTARDTPPMSGHAQGAVRYAHHTLRMEIQTTTAYRAL